MNDPFTAEDYRRVEATTRRFPNDDPTPCLSCSDNTIVACSVVERPDDCAKFQLFTKNGKFMKNVQSATRCGSCGRLDPADRFCSHRKRVVRLDSMPCVNYEQRGLV